MVKEKQSMNKRLNSAIKWIPVSANHRVTRDSSRCSAYSDIWAQAAAKCAGSTVGHCQEPDFLATKLASGDEGAEALVAAAGEIGTYTCSGKPRVRGFQCRPTGLGWRCRGGIASGRRRAKGVRIRQGIMSFGEYCAELGSVGEGESCWG